MVCLGLLSSGVEWVRRGRRASALALGRAGRRIVQTLFGVRSARCLGSLSALARQAFDHWRLARRARERVRSKAQGGPSPEGARAGFRDGLAPFAWKTPLRGVRGEPFLEVNDDGQG
jgi:hypothetical protein